jgi:hypothetical protein
MVIAQKSSQGLKYTFCLFFQARAQELLAIISSTPATGDATMLRVCVCVYVYVCVYIYIYIYSVCVCIYIYMYVRLYDTQYTSVCLFVPVPVRVYDAQFTSAC